MNCLNRFSVSLLFGGAYLGFVGCGPSPSKPAPNAAKHGDHDHEEHPDTYAEAVKKIDELRTTIKDALAKNDKDKADKPLHELGELLRDDKTDDVENLAKKESFDQAKLDEIKKAVDQLLDAFGEVDDKIHDKENKGKGATYEEMSDKIDAALATLRQHVPGGK